MTAFMVPLAMTEDALRRVEAVIIVRARRPNVDFICGQPDRMVLPGDFLIATAKTLGAVAGAT